MPRTVSFKPYKERDRWALYLPGSITGGKPRREYFDTRDEAKERAIVLRTKYENFGTRASTLTLAEELDARGALDLLSEGESLTGIVRAHIDAHRARSESIPFADLCQLYPEARGLGRASRDEYKRLGRRFTPHFGGMVADITPAAIDAALDAETGHSTPATRKHYRSLLRAVLGFAARRGLIAGNPVDGTETPKTLAREPRVLTVAECSRLLSKAQAYREGELLGLVVLGLFCGLRKAESHRVAAEDIRNGQLYLSAGKAKTDRPRYVQLSDNAQAWLAVAPLPPEPSRTLYTRFKTLREQAKIDHWQSNTLRHTACSYHYAKHRDESALEAWAGHSREVDKIHYRAAILPAQAEAFWAIFPAETLPKTSRISA